MNKMDKLYTAKELRQMTELSQQKFANFTHIPVATIQQWEQKINRTPEYTLWLLNYYVLHEIKNIKKE